MEYFKIHRNGSNVCTEKSLDKQLDLPESVCTKKSQA
jgi:hypothetical protein